MISREIEKSLQFDGNPDSILKFLMLPYFLLVFLNLGGRFLAGFLSRFRHRWSLLSTHGQKKRAAVFRLKIVALG